MEKISAAEEKHYLRQVLVDGWGESGQVRLKNATILVAGAGGLGSPLLFYLAAAGVGQIVLIDSDLVESTNLNRQILHTEERIGLPKAESAAATLRPLNPYIEIIAHNERLEEDNAEHLIGKPDLLLDCLDNYETRYLLNRHAIRLGIPLIHGAIWGMFGQVAFLQPPQTACLRCLVPTPPIRQTFPAVGAIAGVIGSIQALEALKYLTGIGDNLKGILLIIDGEDMSINRFNITRRPGCSDCGHI